MIFLKSHWTLYISPNKKGSELKILTSFRSISSLPHHRLTGYFHHQYISKTLFYQVLNPFVIIFYNPFSSPFCPYAEYEWLITENYADYQSYGAEKSKPCLKWTPCTRLVFEKDMVQIQYLV